MEVLVKGVVMIAGYFKEFGISRFFFFFNGDKDQKKFPKVIHLQEKTKTSSDTM